MKCYTFHIDSQVIEEAETEKEAKEKLQKELKAFREGKPGTEDEKLTWNSITENAQVGELLQEE